MKKILLSAAVLAITFVACDKDDSLDGGTASSSNTTGTTNTTGNTSSTKPSATEFKFAANGKTCGILDQQHNAALKSLIHINTDKCNGETVRPTITLNFESLQEIRLHNYFSGQKRLFNSKR